MCICVSVVCVCMYVYMCICVYIYVYVCVCVNACITCCRHTFVCARPAACACEYGVPSHCSCAQLQHSISCCPFYIPLCRDDVIFLIYLYQRWIYRVDMTRVNEFGFSGAAAAEGTAALGAADGATEDEVWNARSRVGGGGRVVMHGVIRGVIQQRTRRSRCSSCACMWLVVHCLCVQLRHHLPAAPTAHTLCALNLVCCACVGYVRTQAPEQPAGEVGAPEESAARRRRGGGAAQQAAADGSADAGDSGSADAARSSDKKAA